MPEDVMPEARFGFAQDSTVPPLRRENGVWLLGGDPFERYQEGDREGMHTNSSVSIFPSSRCIVAAPVNHGQCWQWLKNAARAYPEIGLPLERIVTATHDYVGAVSLNAQIWLRADQHDIDDVVSATQLLEDAFPDRRDFIKYSVLESDVRQYFRERGECYRMNPLALLDNDKHNIVRHSRRWLKPTFKVPYYINIRTGSRYITEDTLAMLLADHSAGKMTNDELDQAALEIKYWSNALNRTGHPEVLPFNCSEPLEGSIEEMLRTMMTRRIDKNLEPFTQRFEDALLRHITDERMTEAREFGFCPEWQSKILWERGAHKKDGTWYFHERATPQVRQLIMRYLGIDGSVYHRNGSWRVPTYVPRDAAREAMSLLGEPAGQGAVRYPASLTPRALALLTRDGHPDESITFVNPGVIVDGNHYRLSTFNRREVRVLEVGRGKEVIFDVIRRQQFDTSDYLDEVARNAYDVDKGTGVHWSPARALDVAHKQARHYVHYQRMTRAQGIVFRINTSQPSLLTLREEYSGERTDIADLVKSHYMRRPYFRGRATHQAIDDYIGDIEFCRNAARLLGRAAAANIVVARGDEKNEVLFNDGDEYFDIDGDSRTPSNVFVRDATGCLFNIIKKGFRGDDYVAISETVPFYWERMRPLFQRHPDVVDLFFNANLSEYESIYNEMYAAFKPFGCGQDMRGAVTRAARELRTQYFAEWHKPRPAGHDVWELAQEMEQGSVWDRTRLACIRTLECSPQQYAALWGYVKKDSVWVRTNDPPYPLTGQRDELPAVYHKTVAA